MAERPSRSHRHVRTALFAAVLALTPLATSLAFSGSLANADPTTPTAPLATTSVASVSPSSTTYGSTVTYTITVSATGEVPLGQAFFQTGNTLLCLTPDLVSGTASCTATNAPAGTDIITAIYPGNAVYAGSSGITDLTVNVPPPPPPAGATASNSAASTNQTGSFVIGEGNLSAQGNGPGAITVATYGASDPTNYPVPGGTGAFDDVAVGSGSNFSSVLVAVCNVGAGSSLDWFNGSGWVPFSQQSLTFGCVFGLVESSTSPSFAQLGGTPIALSTYPAPGSPQGYWLVARDGGIFSFNRPFYGSTGAITLNQPIVGMAPTHDFGGYWMVARDGGVFAFGNATYEGSLPAEDIHTTKVVAIVSNPVTSGYYLVSSDGTVWDFNAPGFGDLPFYGFHVSDIVGAALTPDGEGMYLVGADGRVYNLAGDGVYQGDTSGLQLAAPIVGMAVDPETGGYWLLGRDGGVFSFNAPFYGSTGNLTLNQPVNGMVATQDGGGYWFVAGDGGVFSFGDANFYGSTGAIHLNQPVVGMAGG